MATISEIEGVGEGYAAKLKAAGIGTIEELLAKAGSGSQRDALETELTKLRETKATLPEAEYFAQLEALLVQLARLYR